MNSLEFIEREIELCKHEIQINKIGIENQFDKTFYKNRDEVMNEKLQTLYRIKTELEAWYAIKPELVIDKHVENSYEDEFRTITFKSGCIDDIEILENKSKINAISKALEVEDDR